MKLNRDLERGLEFVQGFVTWVPGFMQGFVMWVCELVQKLGVEK